MLAWHWINEQRTLRDGRRMVVGKTVKHDGPLVLCQSGLHASERLIDALQYAPGPIICRVECGGEIIRGDDKIVCRERRVIAAYDATAELRAFARRCALDVAHLWNMPVIVREYLETGDESKRDAAWDAAWAATRAAARDTALDAAWDATWGEALDAAWDATWGAALDAARAAAWDAARAAAWDAARAAARDAAGDAAGDAAWDAARDAARQRQNDTFTGIVEVAMAKPTPPAGRDGE